MKKVIILLAAVLAINALVSGCAGVVGPWYRGESQYNEGVWGGWANEKQAAQIQRDKVDIAARKMALQKLAVQPVITQSVNGVSQGYLGVAKNFHPRKILNFLLEGPETKSFLIGPKGERRDYLLPGDYICTVYDGDRIVSRRALHVKVQKNNYLGENVHWYAVYTR